jgi:uncharacterized protein YukE
VAGGIEVDLGALRQSAEDLAGVAQQLAGQWSAFSAQVQSLGDIFGDDTVGGLIGASYQAAHAIADSSFTSVIEAFDGFAGGLARCADTHERTEQDIAGRFRRLAG